MIPVTAITAGVAAAMAATVSFFVMDCPPSLFVYDKLCKLNFEGRKVWIVGASSGIGEELAYQLAASKAQQLILSSRSRPSLERVQAMCLAHSPNCNVQVLPMDVTDDASLQATVEQLPKVDLIILNAGQGHLSPALETSAATVRRVLDANVWPMMLMPLLQRRNLLYQTQIAVSSSVAGQLPVPLSAAYAGAKHCLHGYFGSLTAERPDLKITLWCPGPIDTPFHRNHGTTTDSSHDETKNQQKSKLKMPVQRCVRLMLSSLQQQATGPVWIASQPTLTALYLQRYLPGLLNRILRQVGPKRVELWRQGLDVYDPASWKRQSTATRNPHEMASTDTSKPVPQER